MKQLHGSSDVNQACLAAASEKGQMTVEMILLAVIFTSIAILFFSTVRNEGLMAAMVEGPWSYTKGMIESGVWKKAEVAGSYHPNLFYRHLSLQGDSEP